MVKSAALLVLSGCIITQAAAAALGHNHLHVERNAAACNQDNLLRCFIDTRYTQQASDFCSGLGAATVTVTTPLATATATEWLKGAVNVITQVVTATTTVFTETIPSATVTVTGAGTADDDDGSVQKRNAPANPPYCMTYGTTFPASRITSACSCIDVPAATVKVTVASSTKIVTQTMTSNIVSTTSTTIWNTISTDTTSGTLTVTIDNQPLARAPANADPPLNLLFNSGFETSGMKYWDLSPSSGWTPTISSMALSKKSSTYICSIKGATNAGLATLKSTHLVEMNAGWKYKAGFSAIGVSAVPAKIPWASIGYISLKNPEKGTELKLQLDAGTAVGNLNWNIYEAALTMTKEMAGFNEFSLVFIKTGLTINFDDFYLEKVN